MYLTSFSSKDEIATICLIYLVDETELKALDITVDFEIYYSGLKKESSARLNVRAIMFSEIYHTVNFDRVLSANCHKLVQNVLRLSDNNISYEMIADLLTNICPEPVGLCRYCKNTTVSGEYCEHCGAM
jgi:hypothetical protein